MEIASFSIHILKVDIAKDKKRSLSARCGHDFSLIDAETIPIMGKTFNIFIESRIDFN